MTIPVWAVSVVLGRFGTTLFYRVLYSTIHTVEFSIVRLVVVLRYLYLFYHTLGWL